MKKLILIAIASVFTLSAYAGTGDIGSACFNVRAVDFAQCPAGQERVFVKGLCQARYEVESTYCSNTQGNPDCLDLRLANFTACDGKKERINVRGKCFGRNLIEHSYCASR